MHDDSSDREDQALSRLFRREAPAVADHGFTDQVMASVRWQIRLRRLILATAIGIGLAISLAPASVALVEFSGDLAGLISQWTPKSWGSPPLMLAALILGALVLPSVVRMLEA